MSARTYPAIALTAFLSRLAYRNQVWMGVFGGLVTTYAYIAVWHAAYAGATEVNGVTLTEMTTYVVLAGQVLVWYYSRYILDLGATVTSGDVTVHLLRPLYFPGLQLATQFGIYAMELLALVVPLVVIVALTVGILPPASPGHALLFLAYWALSWLMIFVLATITGLLAFWLLTAFSLDWFLRGIMALASGSIIPLWFMPAPLAATLGYLPFSWVSYYPTAVYLGKLDIPGALLHFGIGLAWLAALTAALVWLWSRARNRMIVQGG